MLTLAFEIERTKRNVVERDLNGSRRKRKPKNSVSSVWSCKIDTQTDFKNSNAKSSDVNITNLALL